MFSREWYMVLARIAGLFLTTSPLCFRGYQSLGTCSMFGGNALKSGASKTLVLQLPHIALLDEKVAESSHSTQRLIHFMFSCQTCHSSILEAPFSSHCYV